MKRLLALLIITCVSPAFAQTVEPLDLIGADECAATKRSLNPFAAQWLLKSGPGGRDQRASDDERAANNTTTDLTHYNLDITIDPTASTISGSNILSFTSLTNNLTTLQIRLSSAFTVNASSGIQVNGVNRTWSRLNSSTIQVNLGQTFSVGQSFDVKVTYSGAPGSGGGFGSITFRTRNGAREVFTLSETDYAYTWFPCKENNSDKSTADMRFTVPNTMKVASNGVLMSTTPVSGNRTQFYYKTDYPTATYLYSFAATNFNTFSTTWNFTPETGPAVSMPVNFWIYPESDTTNNRNAWLQVTSMLTAFSPEGRLGLYPFSAEKYGIYHFGFGGGMEHQTCTGQGTFATSVTAHELGHQWFGDMVTCATWNHIWLNEGLATYTEALWEQWKPGSFGFASLRSAMGVRRPSNVGGTVYCPTTTDMNRIFSTDFSYRKGAWVAHMLRGVVGETAFFQALKNYRQTYLYGSATTEELQAIFQNVYGGDLEWFFDQWVYQPGAPTYNFGWRNVSAAGRDYIEVYIAQTQSASYPRFRMPLQVHVTPQSGGPAQIYTVLNDGAVENFLIPLAEPAANAAFDPDTWVLWAFVNTGIFAEGPPKVVAVSPEPGAAVLTQNATAVSVTFHKAVNAPASEFSLTGPLGTVPCSFSYDAPSKSATLTPAAPLTPGQYTLTVLSGVTDTASGRLLDGETAANNDPNALPSGDGQAGGAFTSVFTVATPAACFGDINGDHSQDTADLTILLQNFGTSVPQNTLGDLSADGVVNTLDLTLLLATFGVPCP